MSGPASETVSGPGTLPPLTAAEFWPAFVPRHWERSAVAVAAGAEGLASGEDLFLSVCRACRNPDRVELAVAGAFVADRARRAALLPVEADATLAGWDARLCAELGAGADFMLRVGHLQLHDEARWRWACRFLRPLYDAVGLPSGGVDLGAFLGRYRRTAFGVHVDPQSALTFPVLGGKRVRVWPDEAARALPLLAGAQDYGSMTAGSVLLEAAPGGFLYWPSTAWHVGEGGDELTAAWNISFSYHTPADVLRALAARLLQPLEAATAGGALPAHLSFSSDRPAAAVELPAALGDLGEALHRGFAPAAVRAELVRTWLKRVSAFGFAHVPRVTGGARLEGDDVVRGDPDFPLLHARSGAGPEVLLACRGMLLEVGDRAGLVELVERVNSGARLAVRALGEELARTPATTAAAGSASFFTSLLEQLRAMGGIERVAR